jgi:hypothetical protein
MPAPLHIEIMLPAIQPFLANPVIVATCHCVLQCAPLDYARNRTLTLSGQYVSKSNMCDREALYRPVTALDMNTPSAQQDDDGRGSPSSLRHHACMSIFQQTT